MGAEGVWWLHWSSKPARPAKPRVGGFDSHTLPPSVELPPHPTKPKPKNAKKTLRTIVRRWGGGSLSQCQRDVREYRVCIVTPRRDIRRELPVRDNSNDNTIIRRLLHHNPHKLAEAKE